MDSFAEQIVTKEGAKRDTMKRGLIVCASFAVGLLLVVIGTAVGFLLVGALLAVGAVYAGIYLSANFDVEYEYSVTNGEFDLDKILAKRKRMHMLTAEVKNFESFEKCTQTNWEPDSEVTLISASGPDRDKYYADFKDEKYGRCRLVFTPDDNMLMNIKPFLKGTLRNNIPDIMLDEGKDERD
ncbi:MAG: hypothetical protein Q4F95_08365 [Oscillospiraceae bacterium]|nr:hypothetical protein [Oscillospiraceae bacterium]